MALDSDPLVRDMSRSASPVRGLEQRVLTQLKSLDLVPGSPIGVAFSGGTDSLALAAVLARIAPAASVAPLLFHVNHQLRPGSSVDADQCKQLAHRLSLPIHVAMVDPDAMLRHRGVGIEEAARRERYRLLAGLAQANDAVCLAVGHHADDQAETVLMHLLRGSGLHGAVAMSSWIEMQIPWWPVDDPASGTHSLRVWRPFLNERRSDLTRYAAQFGLEPVEDESNLDARFLRNRIRHEVLPLLEEVREGATLALVRYGAIASEEDRYLTKLADESFRRSVNGQGGLDRARLAEEPVVLQRRVIYRWLLDRGAESPSFDRVEAVRELLFSPRGDAVIEVGNNVSAMRLGPVLVAGKSEWLAKQRALPSDDVAYDN